MFLYFDACILMYIYIRIGFMQADSMSVRKRALGALPVLHHYLRQLRWPQLLTPLIGHGAYIEALELLVKSVLLKPNALYRIGAWCSVPRFFREPFPNGFVLNG
jgi:hypothetical protein